MKIAKKTTFVLLIVLGAVATLSLGFEIFRLIVREDNSTMYLVQRIMNVFILPVFIFMSVYLSLFVYKRTKMVPPGVYLLCGILFFSGSIAMLFTTTSGIFFMAFATLTTSFFGLPAGWMCCTLWDKTRLKV